MATPESSTAAPEMAMLQRMRDDPEREDPLRNYDGGKGGAGVFHALINLMPRHDVYVEPFLGAGNVLRRKRPAAASIGIERDPETLKLWRGDEIPALTLLEGDAIAWLRKSYLEPSPEVAWGSGARSRIAKTGEASDRRRRSSVSARAAALERTSPVPAMVATSTLIYCDPPYLMSTRSCSHRPLYRCELSDAQHVELLGVLLALPCQVILSGYQSGLYRRMLKGWRTASFWTTNRAGRRVQEWVWMNFPEPRELHDYWYLGDGWRERARIRKQQRRWRAKLEKMPALERHALMAVLAETSSG